MLGRQVGSKDSNSCFFFPLIFAFHVAKPWEGVATCNGDSPEWWMWLHLC